MAKAQANRKDCTGSCQLHAECIKISGRSDVFNVTSRKYDGEKLILVSKTAVRPGTCLIVRMLDFPAVQPEAGGFLRAAGIAEVQSVREIMEEDGLAYELGVKYLYTD